MNGAESLLRTLVNGGVEVCFTNPGTSEMQFVAAVDRVEGMRTVLCLFEGVCSAAADGYARMAGKPACTLLHLGPGLSNASANLHNARRAKTPLINIVGDHATYHRQYDAPLNSDIESLSRPVSGWVKNVISAHTIASDAAASIAAAMTPPGQIATLIVPADCSWDEAGHPASAPALPVRRPASDAAIDESAKALLSGEPSVILMNGEALGAQGIELASRIAQHTGAKLLTDTFCARVERGAGRAVIDRLPYFAEAAMAALAGCRHLVLVGTTPPVSFFAYPGKPSWLTPEDAGIHTLTRPEEDSIGALEALAEAVKAPKDAARFYSIERPALPAPGPITSDAVAAAVGALMPENAIVVDESATSGTNLMSLTAGAPPHDWLSLTGGSIGMGTPLAVGAATACPDRKVLSMHGDGGAMYTLQALWTQAREKLDVINVIYSNRKYTILQIELHRVGVEQPGPKAIDMLDLSNPDLDWVKLGQGMGVHSTLATTTEEFNKQFEYAVNNPGPHLIEVTI